jgi:hypothetical protein
MKIYRLHLEIQSRTDCDEWSNNPFACSLISIQIDGIRHWRFLKVRTKYHSDVSLNVFVIVSFLINVRRKSINR